MVGKEGLNLDPLDGSWEADMLQAFGGDAGKIAGLRGLM